MDYGLNLETAIELCKLVLNNRTYVNELRGQCECLSIDELCNNCKLFMSNNDLLICKKYLKLLYEKRNFLNGLSWLDIEE